MLIKLVIILLAISLIIAGPIAMIIIMNFLLSQMFVTYIPLQITALNWFAVAVIEIFIAGSHIGAN